MLKTKKNINLAPKDEFKSSPAGKILSWIINVGRYIVIGTEFIVIIAFLFRFKLDNDIKNIYEEITKNQAIISSYEKLEAKANSIQKRLELITTTKNESPDTAFIIEELSKLVPIDIVFSSLNLDKNKITIEGEALSNIGLATFLNGLSLNKNFYDINLESVSSESQAGSVLEFKIIASYGQKPK